MHVFLDSIPLDPTRIPCIYTVPVPLSHMEAQELFYSANGAGI